MELGITDSTVMFSCIAKMNSSKGVIVFKEAARMLSSRYPEAMFLLVGPLEEDNPQAVPAKSISVDDIPRFRWIGFREDIKEIISLSRAVVLPSFYREGVPRVLLEALAMARPVITTDNVGCKETVEHERNGFMVPVRNIGALAGAMERLIIDKDLAERFGEYSRKKAIEEFDEEIVADRVLKELYGYN
jgi:N,N'-diacetylbacillosaminyl-diphospho-undecaprenol alpha-1,3-N-acetylgalactosaminyltransferase